MATTVYQRKGGTLENVTMDGGLTEAEVAQMRKEIGLAQIAARAAKATADAALPTDGVAVAATKLETPRDLLVDLTKHAGQAFDGTANAGSIGCVGVLPLEHGGTGGDTAAKACKALGALPLTGGKINGALTIKGELVLDYHASNGFRSLSFQDERVEGASQITGVVRNIYAPGNDYTQSLLEARAYKDDGTLVTASVAAKAQKDGTAYSATQTPAANAPNNAIQTKESVARDFVNKSGGSMTNSLIFERGAPVIKCSACELGGAAPANAEQRFINWQDKNNTRLAQVAYVHRADNSKLLSLGLFGKSLSEAASLNLSYDAAGKAYADCPVISDAYGTGIVNNRRLMDYAPQKLTSEINIYVGGANASDTADLFNGRGLTSDKPFATLGAALAFIRGNFFAPSLYLTIIPQADLTGNFTIWGHGLRCLRIGHPSQKYTITGNMTVLSGAVCLRNLKLVAPADTVYLIYMNGAEGGRPHLRILENVELSGTVTGAAIASDYGSIVLISKPLTGAITGKRYLVASGGAIYTNGKGPNAIPGTVAGTCDSVSVYY